MRGTLAGVFAVIHNIRWQYEWLSWPPWKQESLVQDWTEYIFLKITQEKRCSRCLQTRHYDRIYLNASLFVLQCKIKLMGIWMLKNQICFITMATGKKLASRSLSRVLATKVHETEVGKKKSQETTFTIVKLCIDHDTENLWLHSLLPSFGSKRSLLIASPWETQELAEYRTSHTALVSSLLFFYPNYSPSNLRNSGCKEMIQGDSLLSLVSESHCYSTLGIVIFIAIYISIAHHCSWSRVFCRK